MDLSSYRCPLQRLVHLFYHGRDLWKQRAAAKQDEIRRLRVKVRDLTASRDYWKKRALQTPPPHDDSPAPAAPLGGE